MTPQPVEWSPLAQEAAFPRVYHWLARQQGVDAVLELPMQDNSTDILYMYYATLHRKPLVNGYSGYIPDHYIVLQKNCCFPLPDPSISSACATGASPMCCCTRRRWTGGGSGARPCAGGAIPGTHRVRRSALRVYRIQ